MDRCVCCSRLLVWGVALRALGEVFCMVTFVGYEEAGFYESRGCPSLKHSSIAGVFWDLLHELSLLGSGVQFCFPGFVLYKFS